MTGYTPFTLAYGSEAMIPIELEVSSYRKIHYDSKKSEKLMSDLFDMIDEKRDEVDLRAVAHRKQVAQHYNTKIKNRTFKIDDLVLKRIFSGVVNMDPIWEGPYAIEHKLQDRTFKLTTVNEISLPRTWNSEHLRR